MAGENPEIPEDEQKKLEETEWGRKILKEKKNVQAKNKELEERLAEKEAKLKEIEEAKLKENNEWKTLAEKKDLELKTEREKNAKIEQDIQAAKKKSEVKKALLKENINPERLEAVMSNMVKLDKVEYHSSTGAIVGVEDVVRDVKALIPEAFVTEANPKHPAPNPEHGKKMTKEDWQKLSPKERENPETRKRYMESMGVAAR